MIDIKQKRLESIRKHIEDIYIFAGNRVDWWKDSKIQERIMFIRKFIMSNLIWTCSHCKRQNPWYDDYCVACGAPKPVE